jgi:hypothetical protein
LIGSKEVEPNNTFDQANGFLRSGQDYFGLPDDNNDYFKILTTAVGTITVKLSNFKTTGGQVILYDSSYKQFGYNCPAPLGSCSISTANAPIGWYFIRVYTAGNFDTVDWYTLNVTFP